FPDFSHQFHCFNFHDLVPQLVCEFPASGSQAADSRNYTHESSPSLFQYEMSLNEGRVSSTSM
ncbi:MAG: hypothetical protein ACR2PJ_03330, partial [Pseudomonadales bacterium]